MPKYHHRHRRGGRERYGRKNETMRNIMLIIAAVVVLLVIAAYAGIQPLATYKDRITSEITPLIGKFTPLSQPILQQSQLNGTYTATGILGFSQTASFQGDTVTFYNKLDGKRAFEYTIPGGLETGQEMNLKNVITGIMETQTFKYIKKQDCFTLGRDTYYR